MPKYTGQKKGERNVKIKIKTRKRNKRSSKAKKIDQKKLNEEVLSSAADAIMKQPAFYIMTFNNFPLNKDGKRHQQHHSRGFQSLSCHQSPPERCKCCRRANCCCK